MFKLLLSVGFCGIVMSAQASTETLVTSGGNDAGPFSSLALRKNYRSMRASSEDRPGNADFLRIAAGVTTTIAELEGPGEIVHLWTTINPPEPALLREIVIRIYWDGNEFPSVECPIGDFYGIGNAQYYHFDNPMQAIGTDRGMNAFWPMPFVKSARVEIANEGKHDIGSFYYYIDWRKFDAPREDALYFHAQYRQEHPTVSGRNYLFCETGGGPGHFAGVNLSIHTQVEGWWGEGDDIFTIDGEERPSLWGTGSEDYFCGAWGYGEIFYTDYFGMPQRTRIDQGADNFWNVYRLHLESPITFERSIKVEIEHGDNGVSNRRGGKNNNYASVAYYYVSQPQRLLGPLPPADQRLPKFEPPPEPHVPEGVVEAHRMKYDKPDKGSLEKQMMEGFTTTERKGWLGDSQLFRAHAAEDDVQELTFETTGTIKGDGALRLTRARDYGRISISLDGKTIVRSFDGYAERVEPAVVPLNNLNLKSGRHVLRVRVTGKNDKSEGYNWGIDYLRVGREPVKDLEDDEGDSEE